MKHKMVTFRLHRKGVVLLAVGACLVGVLLFAAGYLLALRRSRAVAAAAPSQAAVPGASLPAAAAPAITGPRIAGPSVSAPAATLPGLPAIVSSVPMPASQASQEEKKESPETPHISDEAFALRVGSFMEEADAKAFVEALKARGHEPVVAPVTTENGVVLHTVLIGRYASRDEAAAAAAKLKQKEELSCAVVPAARAAGEG